MGVITPTCDAGYAVTSEEVRKVLEICGSWAKGHQVLHGIGGANGVPCSNSMIEIGSGYHDVR